jgi:long-chain-fatty-acid--CoA ligase ACSBG
VGVNGTSGWGYSLANKLILSKIKANLGLDECKFMFSGAAPLSMETLEYFASLGININEVYGMSESTGATTWSTDETHQWTSIGYEMHGCEVKIFQESQGGAALVECPPAQDFFSPPEESQGEVCFRGRHIMMGYLCNPKLGKEHVAEMTKKNEETIDKNGWLHSGDKGSKDVNNMFRITGRYKELIITAGGENISPVPIENALKLNCPAISNAMMVGDKRKFNIVLVTLKAVGATGELPGTEELDGAAVAHGCKTIPEASSNSDYIKMIEDAIKKTNADGTVCPSNASKIQKFTILPQDFSVETDEITPSLKLKRSVATNKYINIVEKIYLSKDSYTPYKEAPVAKN